MAEGRKTRASPVETTGLRRILTEISGTKESIKKAKDFIVSHDISGLRIDIRDFVESESCSYDQGLYALYLLNELFFNADESYRSHLFLELPRVIKSIIKRAPDEEARDRVMRLVRLWGSKHIFSPQAMATLLLAGNKPTPPQLDSVPVGLMADILRAALASGHQPWQPLDTALPPITPSVHQESRLEQRLADFYRSLDLKRSHKRRPVESSLRDNALPSSALPKRPRYNKLPLPMSPVEEPPKSIGDENLGKQMLRGMGWQEGRGLGSQGTGRSEPIADSGQTDTNGIGARPKDDAFSQYRSQLSSAFKARYSTL